MQNVWLPAFKCTARHGSRSFINGSSASAAREVAAFRPLWSSIVTSPWWSQPLAYDCRDEHNAIRYLRRPFHHSPLQSARKDRRNPLKAPPEAPAAGEKQRIRIPFGSLTGVQLSKIFGQEVDYNGGNETLRILHGRRVTGALVEKGLDMDGNDQIPEDALSKALEWLRKKYPIDEASAAESWAEAESQKLGQQYIERAERLGLYKKIEPENQDDGAYSTTLTGRSALEELRDFHKKRREDEKQEKMKTGEYQREQSMQLAKQEEREQAKMELYERIEQRREARRKKGMVSEEEEVPNKSRTERLFLPTSFGVLTCWLTYIWATLYEPPTLENRMYPGVPNSIATVGVIIGANLCVWSFWRMPPLWRLLNKYTLVVPALPVSFSLLGNIFSHQKLAHLIPNMAGLALWGVTLHEDIGRGNFMAIYLSGGIIGAMTSLWSHVLTARFQTTSQGASGGVYAIAFAWAWLYWDKPTLPTADNTSDFLLDVGRWAALVFSILPHFLPAFWQTADVAAHLGGAVVGMVGAVAVTAQRKRSVQVREAEDRLKANTVGEAPAQP